MLVDTICKSDRERERDGERNGNPLQYSCLKKTMDRGALWALVHWVIKSWRRLSTEGRKASPKPQVSGCRAAMWGARVASATTRRGLAHSGVTRRTSSPPVMELRPQEVTMPCPLAYEIQAEEGGRWRLTALIPCRT